MTFRNSLHKIALALLILWVAGGPAVAAEEPEAAYYSDRFIFRGNDINDSLLVLLNFNRGREGFKYTGELFGAIFYKGFGSFLEGNNQYPYAPKELSIIQPSYFAKAEGSPVSGFKLHYDGGDFVFNLSSGPTEPLYIAATGPTLQSSVNLAEAVLTLRGKEYWGTLIHEPLVWIGLNHFSSKIKGRHKEYQRLYLTTEKGRQIYLYREKADLRSFQERYHLKETLPAEGGSVRSGPQSTLILKPPLPLTLLESSYPPFAFYTVPRRWKVDAPPVGTFYLWSRETASQNWLWGGYYLMAIEGVLKTGDQDQEERVWGLAEYIP